MLTRSKIKMQQSVRQIQHDLPYFNNEEQHTPTHMYKQSKPQNYSKVTNKYSDNSQQVHYKSDYFDFNHGDTHNKANNPTRNQILKELRQEYEILKNLSVEDSINLHAKNYEHRDAPKFSASSSLSSSMHSKKSSKARDSEHEVRSPKLGSKEMETLHLEKKQLEIVIGNSMRKIEELLNNEILLKKSIHELKNQLEGKGGVHQEYEKSLKALQKNEEELHEELSKAQRQNEKSLQKIKELNEKIRYYEGQLANKEREIKQGFEEQKKLHELLRIEKDRYLNLQIQCKTYKMQFDLLQKQKNNEMNRLIRQFQSKEGGNQKEMAYIIKKLEEDLKEKDKKYHDLLIEKQQLKRDKVSDAATDKKSEKNYLEEMMYKSREMNDYNNKALADSVNLIYNKMAEIEKKTDETLKREIENLKKKVEEGKKNTNEQDLQVRIAELERNIEREISEKNRYSQEAKRLKEQLYDLEDRNKQLEKKTRDFEQREHQLKEELLEYEKTKAHFNSTLNQYKNLQEEVVNYTQRINQLQSEVNSHRELTNTLTLSFREKEKKTEDEIRVLKRQIDEAEFQTEKARKEGEFNHTILKSEHEREAKKIVQEYNNLSVKLTETEETLNHLRESNDGKIKSKESDVSNLKNVIDSLKLKSQEDLNNQKKFYDDKLAAFENRHNQDIKQFGDKFIAVSASNDKLMSQISTYSRMEAEVIDLRRVLKQTRTMNSTIHHLWDIKQAEYGNINQTLNSLKAR